MTTELTILYKHGDYIVHKRHCREVPYEGVPVFDHWQADMDTPEELSVTLWGDIASDSFQLFSPEWTEEVQRLMDENTTIKPCVKF